MQPKLLFILSDNFLIFKFRNFTFDLKDIIVNNYKKTRMFVNFYALKWYEARRLKKWVRRSNFVQKLGLFMFYVVLFFITLLCYFFKFLPNVETFILCFRFLYLFLRFLSKNETTHPSICKVSDLHLIPCCVRVSTTPRFIGQLQHCEIDLAFILHFKRFLKTQKI